MHDDAEFSPTDPAIEGLTWREQEVLLLLSDRLTNHEIAVQLHLNETTVKDYVSRILGKLYVKNRRQAVVRAKELGLLNQDWHAPSSPRHNLPAEPAALHWAGGATFRDPPPTI